MADDFIIMMEDDDDFIIMEEEEEISLSSLSFSEKRFLLCIDVGIQHLGFSVLEFNDEFEFVRIVGIDLVDITNWNCQKEDCYLFHTKTFTDWMEHVFFHYSCMFEEVEKIIIEKQPPQGLVAIEQLIFQRFRNKTELVAPQKMFSYFNINGFSYDERKQYTESICEKYLPLSMKKEYKSFTRQHDIADSVCLGLYYLDSLRKKLHDNRVREKARNFRMENSGISVKEYLWQFKSDLFVNNYRNYRL